jgi:hypothetical protein
MAKGNGTISFSAGGEVDIEEAKRLVGQMDWGLGPGKVMPDGEDLRDLIPKAKSPAEVWAKFNRRLSPAEREAALKG